jgi:preprotein translocase SecE subunit
MADEQPVKAKRQVKSPETFRERALKASEAAGQPKTGSRIRLVADSFLRRVISPFFKLLKTVFTLPPFRVLGRLLRPIGKILRKVLFIDALRNSWQELRLVTWPNWRQSSRLTLAVLAFAVVFGAVIAGVDFAVEKVFRNILLK